MRPRRSPFNRPSSFLFFLLNIFSITQSDFSPTTVMEDITGKVFSSPFRSPIILTGLIPLFFLNLCYFNLSFFMRLSIFFFLSNGLFLLFLAEFSFSLSNHQSTIIIFLSLRSFSPFFRSHLFSSPYLSFNSPTVTISLL